MLPCLVLESSSAEYEETNYFSSLFFKESNWQTLISRLLRLCVLLLLLAIPLWGGFCFWRAMSGPLSTPLSQYHLCAHCPVHAQYARCHRRYTHCRTVAIVLPQREACSMQEVCSCILLHNSMLTATVQRLAYFLPQREACIPLFWHERLTACFLQWHAEYTWVFVGWDMTDIFWYPVEIFFSL